MRIRYAWLLAVVIAPLAEETFFRAFLFTALLQPLGFGWAAAASSLIFALGHFHLGVVVPIFALGLLLAWLYHTTRSLWTVVAAHQMFNALSLALGT